MFDNEEGSKGKTRKNRVKNLKKFGLEVGKLYQFNGRFRKVYRTKQPNATYQERMEKDYKVYKGDHLIFISADLWVTSTVKRVRSLSEDLKEVKARLEAKGMKVIRTEGYRMSGSNWRRRWIKDNENPRYYFVFYKVPEERFSGRLYIGHSEKFGWINISQMTKEEIMSQFQKIDI